uniref:C2 domain-containing protein n=1 Tax=Magallana gigas TaxID=29159 RepID=A0A8W8HMY6_MAGGI
MNEAAEVTVVVVSAKGLQSKRQGKCKFSVIFGVGSKKYRTTVVKDPDGNPEWNEESTIQVTNPLDQVFFYVTEKDDILGQVNIPVTSLSGPPGHTTIVSLQPHKKCPNPKGELIYRCHVSQYRQAHTPVIKTGSPNSLRTNSATLNFKKRFSLANSPVINLKNRKESKQGGGSKLSTLNKKFSRSIQDIFSFGKSPSSKYSNGPPSPEPPPSMDHLLCQIEKLKLENIALRQENKDMKSYIDRLLPKVIMNCPEALEAERYLNKMG